MAFAARTVWTQQQATSGMKMAFTAVKVALIHYELVSIYYNPTGWPNEVNSVLVGYGIPTFRFEPWLNQDND